MFLNQGPIGMSLIVIVIGFQVWLFRSRWGLRSRAVGEHPKAAETVGIDVIRLRYQNVLYGGVLAGLAGAYMSMEASNSFQAGMTGGRGFIGLAAMIVGPLDADRGVRRGAAVLVDARARPDPQVRSADAAISATRCRRSPASSSMPCRTSSRSSCWPGFVGRSIPPAADGQPYEREAAT